MKKLMLACGILFFCAFVFTGGLFAAEKFAYIDLSRTFSEYAKTKDYDKTLTAKESVAKTEIDKKENEFKQYQDKYNLLSDKEKRG